MNDDNLTTFGSNYSNDALHDVNILASKLYLSAKYSFIQLSFFYDYDMMIMFFLLNEYDKIMTFYY